MAKFSDLLHQTLLHVSGCVGDDEVRFVLDDGRVFILRHEQDCCESVEIVDICGDIADLCDAQVLDAREESNEDDTGRHESATWTFYILQTTKGAVTFRWLGASNGYYSESVSFVAGQATDAEVATIQARQMEQSTAAAAGRGTMRVRL